MSLVQSLRFPFKRENLSVILQIMLIYTVISTIGIIFVVSNPFSSYNFLNNFIVLAYPFFISGYNLAVLRAVAGGQETLPAIKFKRDIPRAWAIFLATIVYSIPYIVLYFGVTNLYGANYGRSGNEASLLMLCGLSLLSIVLGVLIFGILTLGIIRYGFEERSEALYEFSQNLRYFQENKSVILGFWIRALAVGVIYLILQYIAEWALGQVLNTIFANIRSNLWLSIILFNIKSITFQVFIVLFQLSIANLQAQLGLKVQLVYEKDKAG